MFDSTTQTVVPGWHPPPGLLSGPLSSPRVELVPEMGAVDRWSPVVASSSEARRAVEGITACTEDEVSAGLRVLDEVHAELERCLVLVAVEGHRRGLHLCRGLSLHDWLIVRCPGLARSLVCDLVVLAQEWDTAGHAQIREAVVSGGVTVDRAARMVRALRRVRPVTDLATYQSSVGIVLPVAAGGSGADLRRVLDHLVSVALSDRETKARERTVREMRGVNESSLADGSLTRFVVTCDPEGAALLRGILVSPLAAPVPDVTGPDPRTATQRRHDALMTVLSRGMSAPEGIPTTGKAKIFLQMSYDALEDALVGAGHTFTGEGLTAGQVRRLACTADLVPVVLGSDSEVLDMGREVRLATPGQVRRLWLRDRGCSFPGCTVPATWCDAHHVSWWSRGGRTDTANMALLCSRHHTVVHDRDLTATITGWGVTWHV